MTKKSSWVLIGRHPVQEAIETGQSIDKVLVDKKAFPGDLIEACKNAGIPVQKVPKEKLDKFGANHQGVAAFRSQVEYTDLEDLVPHLFDQGISPVLLMLDRITDVGNFGAIARSAEVFAADGLIFPARESAQLNADAVKRSSGALTRIPLIRVKDLVQAARFLKSSGFTIVVAQEDGDVALHAADLTHPVVIVMGSEGEGISPALLRIADVKAFIPQAGKMDSLNVSVAAGIMLYETMKQRQ